MGSVRTEMDALRVAKMFFVTHSGQESLRSDVSLSLVYRATDDSADSSDPLYYVFNRDNGQGFILVSGESDALPVMGYSFDGQFDTLSAPPAMREWMDEYGRIIREMKRKTQDETVRSASPYFPPVQVEPIAPLLKDVNYSQLWPFNAECPVLPTTKERAMTGCVATAMAQVMKYYEWPKRTLMKIPGYQSGKESVMDVREIPESKIEWGKIRAHYNGISKLPPPEEKAVGDLCFMAGAAVKTDYGSTSSGSLQLIPQAMSDYFGFSRDVRHISRSYYDGFEWLQVINNELEQGRPVIYRGKSTNTSHAFVVNGRDAEGLFYITWGWGGDANGYFDITFCRSGESFDGYGCRQAAIIHLAPDDGEHDVAPFLIGLSSRDRELHPQSGDSLSLSATYSFKAGSRDFVGAWGLGYFDDDNVLRLLWESDVFTLAGNATQDQSVTFDIDLPNGTYKLYPLYRNDGEEDWLIMHKQSSFNLTLLLTVDDEGASLSGDLSDAEVETSMAVKGTRYMNMPIDLSCSVRNVGQTDVEGTFYLFLDKVSYVRENSLCLARTGCAITANSNWTEIYRESIMFDAPGWYYLLLSTPENEGVKLLQVDSFEIKYRANPVLTLLDIQMEAVADTCIDFTYYPVVDSDQVHVKLTIANYGGYAEPTFYITNACGDVYYVKKDTVESYVAEKEIDFYFTGQFMDGAINEIFFVCDQFSMYRIYYLYDMYGQIIGSTSSNKLCFFLNRSEEEVGMSMSVSDEARGLRIVARVGGVLLLSDENQRVAIHRMDGVKMDEFDLRRNQTIEIKLEAGLYLINGQKVIVR